MIEIETDKTRRLLKFRFAGKVTADESRQSLEQVRTQLSDLEPGFRLLSDLTRLDFMDPGCVPYIKQTMELCDEKGVSQIVRIIPDPKKDIGLGILSLFHYRRRVPTVTCRSLEEAAEVLAA